MRKTSNKKQVASGVDKNQSSKSMSLPGIPQSRHRVIILVLLLVSVLPAFTGSSLNVAIPTIGAEFKSPTADLGWIVAGYAICCLTLALPFGRLADLTSRRSVFIVGIFLLSIAAGFTVFASSLAAVIVFRLAQGIGAACVFATTIAIINQVFAPERRGQMLGLSTSAVYAGLAAGPVFGGLLTQYIGWRGVFIFILLFGVLTGIIALVCLPKKPAASTRANLGRIDSESDGQAFIGTSLGRNMDPLGILLFTLAAVSVSVGLNFVPGNLFGWVSLIFGVVVLIAFILHEGRVATPLVPLVLFAKGSNFLLSSLSAFFNYSATFAVSYLVSIYCQQVMLFSAAASGLILIISPLAQSIVTPISGRLSDRYSPFRLASLGMAICAVGLTSLLALTFTTSFVHLVISLLVLGIGFAIFSPPNTNAIMSQAPREHSGVASSFVSTMRNSGQMLSMAVITIVMTATLGQTIITDAPPDSIALVMRVCCIIFTMICVVGVFTSLQRKQK